MRKILFINPSYKDTVFGKMRTLVLPPLGLATLASHTPDTYDCSIVDENVDEVVFDADADLVAITATTVQAPRAYAIIKEFKKRGIPTIIGGIHASVMTEEASNYADSVFVGEADDCWAGVLNDFEKGALKQIYRANSYPSLANLPKIRSTTFFEKVFHPIGTNIEGMPVRLFFLFRDPIQRQKTPIQTGS